MVELASRSQFGHQLSQAFESQDPLIFSLQIHTRTPAFGEGERGERLAIAKFLQSVTDKLSNGTPLEPVEAIRDNASGEYVDVGSFAFGAASLAQSVAVIDEGANRDRHERQLHPRGRALEVCQHEPDRFSIEDAS